MNGLRFLVLALSLSALNSCKPREFGVPNDPAASYQDRRTNGQEDGKHVPFDGSAANLLPKPGHGQGH